jgi:hypothetical protein
MSHAGIRTTGGGRRWLYQVRKRVLRAGIRCALVLEALELPAVLG